LGNIRQRKRNP